MELLKMMKIVQCEKNMHRVHKVEREDSGTPDTLIQVTAKYRTSHYSHHTLHPYLFSYTHIHHIQNRYAYTHLLSSPINTKLHSLSTQRGQSNLQR